MSCPIQKFCAWPLQRVFFFVICKCTLRTRTQTWREIECLYRNPMSYNLFRKSWFLQQWSRRLFQLGQRCTDLIPLLENVHVHSRFHVFVQFSFYFFSTLCRPGSWQKNQLKMQCSEAHSFIDVFAAISLFPFVVFIKLGLEFKLPRTNSNLKFENKPCTEII